MQSSYDIAVIGDGFCGLMVAANLARLKPDLKIFWAGNSRFPGRGLAYGTSESCHLLNVRADRMGAWQDDPEHFFKWLESRMPGQQRSEDFLPRALYGAYLDTIRAHAETEGKVVYLSARALDAKHAGGLWRVSLEDGKEIEAKHLVVATGNPAIQDFGWPRNEIYVSDFWRWRFADERLPSLEKDDAVLVVGSGLSAVDAIASCRADGFEGEIFAVSPLGFWPALHDDYAPYKDGEALAAAMKANPTALHYLKTLRERTDKHEWRGVVDSLRPHLPQFWDLLPEREKARFMRHLYGRWNIHRHRVSPQAAEILKGVTLIRGRLAETGDDGAVAIRHRGGREMTRLRAARVFNCAGPAYGRMIADNPLLGSLIEQKFLKPGPLGVGVAAPDTPNLHVLGTPMFGERLETTAVPELRDQAFETAAKILTGL